MNIASLLDSGSLTEWQRNFLSVVLIQVEPLTVTQAYWLGRIANELGGSR